MLQVYASLPDGSYTFTVTATNAAGVAAASPVQHTWTVTLPQYAQITASPAAAAVNPASITSQQTVAFAAYSTAGQDLTSKLQVCTYDDRHLVALPTHSHIQVWTVP